MHAIGKKIFLVVVLAALFFGVWKNNAPQQNEVSLAKTSVQAADELVAAYQNGQDTLMFYSQDIEKREVYHLIQAQHPYLSELSSASYENGNMQLTYEVISEKEQSKGLEKAREMGKKAAQADKSITAKLKSIHDTLIRQCVYAEDDTNRVQMAAGVSQDGRAVCAGYARAFQAMCDGAGLDVYYVEDDALTHAWNVIRLYGETYFIDCTYDDPLPDQGMRVSRNYFMLTAEELQKTHQWNEELYQEFLDSRYPENFAYIQRMQDLQLADDSIRAADTDMPATAEELAELNERMRTEIASSVVKEDADGEERVLTRGELYRMGYEALWDEEDGRRRIEDLIDSYVVPVVIARNMGF